MLSLYKAKCSVSFGIDTPKLSDAWSQALPRSFLRRLHDTVTDFFHLQAIHLRNPQLRDRSGRRFSVSFLGEWKESLTVGFDMAVIFGWCSHLPKHLNCSEAKETPRHTKTSSIHLEEYELNSKWVTYSTKKTNISCFED